MNIVDELTLYEQAKELLESRNYTALKTLLLELNPADIAVLFEDLSPEHLIVIFRLLPKEEAAETFVEMDPDKQEILIKSFNDRELKEVLDELYLDDTVDLIEEMPANVVKRILKQSTPDARKSINELLKYPKDSAGSIMTPEYVSLKKTSTVKEAFKKIRQVGVDKETIYTCYVTDINRKLLGIVTVKQLLLADSDATIEELMETNIIHAHTLEDKEAVANKFDKYDLLALPVVDNEERLVGIVTIDDALDVIQEENTEDIEKIAAMLPSEKTYLKTGVFETFKNRIPWLLLLMVSSTFTGKIISSFETSLASCVILTAFIPMLMGTGGNAGGQSSVTIIRSLSLGDVRMGDILKIMWKELRVSVVCAIVLAIANFAKMLLIDRSDIIAAGQDPITISIIVCVSLAATVILSKIVGSSLPILAKRVGFDPAVMASPFITTIVDAISLIIYFQVASQFIVF